MLRRLLLPAFLATAILPAPAWAGEILATSDTGDLYRLDTRTGQAELLSRIPQMFDIAQTADGQLIGVSSSGTVSAIDPRSGRVRDIGRAGTFVNALMGLEDGTLLGAGRSSIYQLDRRSGRAREVMRIPGFDSSGDLSYGPDGAIYATGLRSDETDVLFRLDLKRGSAEQVGDGLGIARIYCLALSDEGLIGVTEGNQMVRIDVTSGTAERLGWAHAGGACYGAATMELPQWVGG